VTRRRDDGRPRRRAAICAVLLGALAAAATALAAVDARLTTGVAEQRPSLQDLIDRTPAGCALHPPPGIYAGPVVIRKPIRIDGGGRVTIDAGGRGSVVALRTSGAELRGLRLVHSGSNHDGLDAGVTVRGNGNRIVGNTIEDCLFGLDMEQSNGNVVRGNRITSKPLGLGLRGDSVRIWYSFHNQILDNQISNVRDMIIWYSDDNRIAGNHVSGSRYGLHFMYAKHNRVEHNRYEGNSVGVFLMYSADVLLEDNEIRSSAGATGIGVGFKESSGIVLRHNLIMGNARGIYLDISPYQPDTEDRFEGNRIAYNGVGVLFLSGWHGNVFAGNDFDGNFTQVAVNGGGGALHNTWRGNHWDDYRGFDRDGDGRGDTPYELYAYADRIWQDLPYAAFFRGSPVLEAIDFLDRLAPFSEPTLLVRDKAPRLSAQGSPR